MATILMGYDTESAAVGEGLARFLSPEFPQYGPALDAESTARGLEVIGHVHAQAGVPATLFTCGRTLVHSLEALERAKATGLFDVQSHTYSHTLFRDVEYAPTPGTVAVIPASPAVALREELAATSDMIRRLLGHEVVGLRTPFGFHRGLRDRPDLLELLRENGIRYVSSWTRNEENGNPTPWVQPFAYEDEGYPDILEIPAQFWLDGIWFDTYGWHDGAGFRAALIGAVDEIVEQDLVYGVCFHEWAALSANEEGTSWIRGFLEYALQRRVEITTYTDYWRRASGG
ncbi:MAG: polysaccharide deacetylase family protein [Actinobacteria bacterium]|nr:polysaccharide deacetylase family protein [Actinomycetota bacterium]